MEARFCFTIQKLQKLNTKFTKSPACTDRDMAAHLREQAALFTGYIAQARADRAAINY